MSRDILDSSIRAFIAKGSGIPTGQVIKGLTSDEAPDGLYAELHLISETPIGRNTGYQYIGETESFTIEDVMLESFYSVQFYREGATDAASKFVDFARSETGLNWSSTAITDGRIKGANVYEGGSGYSVGDTLVFTPIDGTLASDMPSVQATAWLVPNSAGSLEFITMRNYGEGYYDLPTATVTSDGTGAVISPRGFGFTVKHPLMIRNLTGMIADDFEERAQIDLMICHTRIYKDAESGRVEQILGL